MLASSVVIVPKHKIHNLRAGKGGDHYVGDCEVCGDGVPIFMRRRNNGTHPVCRTAEREAKQRARDRQRSERQVHQQIAAGVETLLDQEYEEEVGEATPQVSVAPHRIVQVNGIAGGEGRRIGTCEVCGEGTPIYVRYSAGQREAYCFNG